MEREYRRLFEQYNLDVISVASTSRSNLKIELMAPNGARKTLFVGPSADRGTHEWKNNERDIKRFAEDNFDNQIAAKLKGVLASGNAKAPPPAMRHVPPRPLPAPAVQPPAPAPVSTQPKESEVNKQSEQAEALARKERETMTTGEVVKLYDWFKNFSFDAHPGIHTRTALRALASQELGFYVSDSRLVDIMNETGKQFPARLPKETHDRTREVAKAVVYLFEKLGEPLPDGLKRVAIGRQLEPTNPNHRDMLP